MKFIPKLLIGHLNSHSHGEHLQSGWHFVRVRLGPWSNYAEHFTGWRWWLYSPLGAFRFDVWWKTK